MTLCEGLATFVEMAAERPARPAPMIMRWRDMPREAESTADVRLWFA